MFKQICPEGRWFVYVAFCFKEFHVEITVPIGLFAVASRSVKRLKET